MSIEVIEQHSCIDADVVEIPQDVWIYGNPTHQAIWLLLAQLVEKCHDKPITYYDLSNRLQGIFSIAEVEEAIRDLHNMGAVRILFDVDHLGRPHKRLEPDLDSDMMWVSIAFISMRLLDLRVQTRMILPCPACGRPMSHDCLRLDDDWLFVSWSCFCPDKPDVTSVVVSEENEPIKSFEMIDVGKGITMYK